MNYPKSKSVDNSYTLHNQKVEDNYAWLEEKSDDTKQWIEEQNKLTEEYLSKVPKREEIFTRMQELANYERKSMYKEVGDYLFYFKNSGLENLPKVYIKNKETKKEEVFIDPNTLSVDATSPVVSLSFSKDSMYCAYGIAKAGADWVEVKIKNIDTKEDLDDTITGVKFDSDVFSKGVSFYKDGFFYPKYTDANTDIDYTSKDIAGKLYYHKIGTFQEEDIVVFENKNTENLIVGSYVDSEENYLVLPTSTGCIGNNIVFAELKDDTKESLKKLEFKEILKGYEFKNEFLGIQNNRAYMLTNKDAKNRKVISYDLEQKKFEDIIKESLTPIESAKLVGGKILVETLKDVQSYVTFYSIEGNLIKELSMPNMGTFLGCSGTQNSKTGYFGEASFLSPTQIYRIDFGTLEFELYESTKSDFDFENYEVKQEFGTSKDGTKIPMFIIKKKDLKFDSTNPTILYGYGGFNISLLPAFSPKILTWIEMGGVFVMANLRGGGEYGEVWHEGGKKHNKQNVFDDTYGCAEYLIDQKYCSNKTLAIQGGSNGGLLAAVCALQRPDLFSVSLPAAGVLDMLKYHTFTCGYQWSDEYGVATNENEFKTLLSYSPYHIIKNTQGYPAFLVTCSDLDDRVVPAHSYKFIAKLQQTKGSKPYLIRVETNSSHGASNLSKYLQEAADILAFTLMNFNK